MMAKLIYLVGASGSGKDSLIAELRVNLCGIMPIIFAHRYITRPAELGGENYISLTPGEFSLRQKAGLFAMNWQSHGYSYAIGIELYHWLSQGFYVVVNGSREYLPKASELFPNLVVCQIVVSPEKLYQRLVTRGRETLPEILERMERAKAFSVSHPSLITINNDYSLTESAHQFMQQVLGVAISN